MSLVVFEGIDGSGKSTLSNAVAKRLKIAWTKEPTFTSEEADRLNIQGRDSEEREVEFLVDRIKHQQVLKSSKHVICDRYIWTGLAYCKLFNPSTFNFAKALYAHPYFIKPDWYIFVDTPPEICANRRDSKDLQRLVSLRESYVKTEPIISKDSLIYRVDGSRDIEELVDLLTKHIKEQIMQERSGK